MISPVCDRCHEELTEPGGLLFGPPDADGYARKYHACKQCFAIVLAEHFGCSLAVAGGADTPLAPSTADAERQRVDADNVPRQDDLRGVRHALRPRPGSTDNHQPARGEPAMTTGSHTPIAVPCEELELILDALGQSIELPGDVVLAIERVRGRFPASWGTTAHPTPEDQAPSLGVIYEVTPTDTARTLGTTVSILLSDGVQAAEACKEALVALDAGELDHARLVLNNYVVGSSTLRSLTDSLYEALPRDGEPVSGY